MCDATKNNIEALMWSPAKCEINYDKKIRFWWKRLQDQERRNAEVL